MVFLIQRAQNKDSRAVHLKLNELERQTKALTAGGQGGGEDVELKPQRGQSRVERHAENDSEHDSIVK